MLREERTNYVLALAHRVRSLIPRAFEIIDVGRSRTSAAGCFGLPAEALERHEKPSVTSVFSSRSFAHVGNGSPLGPALLSFIRQNALESSG